MSRFRQVSNAEAEKRAYPNQLSAPTEDEVRLLGGSGYEHLHLLEALYRSIIGPSRRDDPDAVSIAKPVTRHSGMFGKVGSCLVGDSIQC